MDRLTIQFRDLFDSMNSKDIVNVSLNIHDVSAILASLKCTDAYSASIEKQIQQTFEKMKTDNKNIRLVEGGK